MATCSLTTSLSSQPASRRRYANSVWRAVALGMPSLWGKLIDIDNIVDRGSERWRDEIIRRSGTAPLWIRARDHGSYERREDTQQFLLDLVARHIHRIQRLAILGPRYMSLNLTLPVLCAPAPLLESCEASFGCRMTDADHDAPPAPLFANHAPMLRRLRLGYWRANPRAPWLHHLHSIAIGHPCSARRAIAVLSRTHILQELKIENIGLLIVSPFPHIASLPCLKSLEYNGSAAAGAALLEHLVIPADCSLTVRLPDDYDNTRLTIEDKADVLSVINIFTWHAGRALQSLIFSSIHLIYTRKYSIHLVIQKKGGPNPTGLLSIWIPLCGDSDANLLEAFLKKLLALDLTSVQALTLRTDGRFNPCFGPFFSCLPSVSKLFVDLRTLSQIAHLQAKYISKPINTPIIMFPMLDVVELPECSTYFSRSRRNFYVNRVAGTFLLMRLRAGHPITRLDLAELPSFTSMPNLDSLAEVKGLKVLYRLAAVKAPGIVEYTCGSDSPKNAYRIVVLLSKSVL